MKHTPESVGDLVRVLQSASVVFKMPRLAEASQALSDLLAENERMREALEPESLRNVIGVLMLAGYPATANALLELVERQEAALTPESKE